MCLIVLATVQVIATGDTIAVVAFDLVQHKSLY